MSLAFCRSVSLYSIVFSITKKHYAEPDMGVLKKIVDNVIAIK
jgi:hypothetical protein